MTAAPPLGLQAMILKVSGYDLKVEYLPGTKQILADILSRASLNEEPLQEDEIQVNMLERISISEPKYAELWQNTENELHELASHKTSGSTQHPAILEHS